MTLLRDVAGQLVAGHPVPRGQVRERVVAGAQVLNDLGGLAEAGEVEGTLVIQGWSCPLASLVVAHPELCLLVATMLAQMIGPPVQERCDRREPPRCFFVVPTSSEDSGGRARSRGATGPRPPR
jgi:predicted ArsR family transcriptional regulator